MEPKLILQSSDNLDILNEERTELLRSINEARRFRHSVNNSESASLNQLEAQYNSLMDQIEAFKISPRQDPLEILPPEIWREVLDIVREEESLLSWDVNPILPFTLVSKSWQRKITSTQSFWTQIELWDRIEDIEAKVALCIHLSGELPLNVSFRASRSMWDSIGPVIAAQGHRIRSLCIFEDVPLTSDDTSLRKLEIRPLLEMFLTISGKLSALEEITIYGPEENLNFLLKGAIKLRSVGGIQLSAETLDLDSMEKLRRLIVSRSHYEVLPHIRDLSNLNEMQFQCSAISTEGAEAEMFHGNEREDVTGINQKLERLEGCTRLTLQYHPGRLGWSLLNTVSSSLHDLHISIPWALLPNLMICCSRMIKLVDLTLVLPLSLEADFQPLSIEGSKTNIQSINLSIKRPHYYLDIDTETLAACQTPTTLLAEALIMWAPNVERLDISTQVDHTFALPYIRNLKSLISLTVSGCRHASETVAVTALSNIKDLCVTGRSSILSAFSYPNICELSLSDFIDHEGSRFHSFTEQLFQDANNWSSLKILDLEDSNANWNGISLPRVEMITIEPYTGFMKRLSPSFLKELASNATTFPSLHTLNMRSFPEWDLLFVMLERRNFSVSSKAVPIKTIGLTTFPAPIILLPLIERLRRRISKRPSNFDISLQSLAETYFDRSLPGCKLCHLAFLPCTKSSYYHNRLRRNINAIQDLQTPPYPSDDDELIATCESRAEWWKNTYQRIGGRCSPCRRHDGYDLTQITGDTWANLSEALDPTQSACQYYTAFPFTSCERQL